MTAPQLRSLALAASLLAVSGCGAKKPVLYPNPHLRSVGTEVAELDVDECMELADSDVGNRNVAAESGTGAAVGGASGAAVGAAGGAVRGNAGRGASVGAATGATAGMLRGLFRARDPDPVFAQYVTICLQERGYRMIGWR